MSGGKGSVLLAFLLFFFLFSSELAAARKLMVAGNNAAVMHEGRTTFVTPRTQYSDRPPCYRTSPYEDCPSFQPPVCDPYTQNCPPKN
ncbi:hypothetical protein SDJN03_17694, partial [Cucurbita argyrosperma subsp. sororia]